MSLVQQTNLLKGSGTGGGNTPPANYLISQGMMSTPANSGFVVDPTGVNDSTAGLQAWFHYLADTGKLGYLGPGTYKTTAELVAGPTTGTAKSFALMGAGSNSTIIKPTASTYNTIRVNITGGDAENPTGFIQDIGVLGPAFNPTTGKAGIIMDTTVLFCLFRCSVGNCDIGYDFIGDSYNCALIYCTTPRPGTCNVSVNIRAGDISGSDITFTDCNFTAYLTVACVAGNGGGYTFKDGQWTTSNTTTQDQWGVITIGWDYISNTEIDSVQGTVFDGIGIEGPRGRHMIRSYGQNFVRFRNLHFNADQQANQCLDVYKATDVKNGIVTFSDCEAKGYFANAALASIAGNYGGNQHIIEGPWFFQGGLTCNGAGVNPGLIASLAEQSALTIGFGVFFYPCTGIILNGTVRCAVNNASLVGGGGLAPGALWMYSTAGGNAGTWNLGQ